MNVPNAALQCIRERVTPPAVQTVSLFDNRRNGKEPDPFTFAANGESGFVFNWLLARARYVSL